ncbi:MAG TPA: TPM domain-containing protein, partial [Candidatus Limnocylindrales bacterium]|nr:TPM domain-containing protein [Candidatus Limnocylindrales bacterium]
MKKRPHPIGPARRRRARNVVGALALGPVVVLSLLLAGPVLAADIPRLSGPVTDQTGVLDGRVDEIEAALEDLRDEHGVQLFVLYVPTTDELTAEEFVDQTAFNNSLGVDDALVLVAIEDRTDQIWVADGLDEITDDELDAIIADVLEPRLGDGDFAGAAIATAEALGEAASTEPASAPPATPGPVVTPPPGGTVGDGDGGGGILGWLLVGGGIVVLLVVGVRWIGSTLTQRREAEERDRRTGRLAREANALLVETDERIRTARQEIDYVEAAYGTNETAPLRTAVGDAQQQLRAAFEIRQRLDDAEPEDPPTREAMLTEIVERCRAAQAALDREAQRIQQLRDLERDAPTVLSELVPRIEAVEARRPAVDAAMAELERIAPAAAAPIRGNLAEASKGLAGARAAIDAGLAALARDDRRTAAQQARTAIVGVDGATTLFDAVEKGLAGAREALARVPGELEAAATGLAEAAAAMAGSANPTHRDRLAAAEEALRAARAAADGGDPVVALRAATEAHRVADEAEAAIRQAVLERNRLLASADASLAAARADIDRAADFIAARRTGVGRTARTRLAEAERHFEAAFAARDSDPQSAIATARRAEQLAEQAYGLADRDFSDWDGGGFGGPGLPRGGGSEVMGAVLGGILGGILSGGGRGGGGWGGSPWGSQGPFGGGGGWGGGRSRGG